MVRRFACQRKPLRKNYPPLTVDETQKLLSGGCREQAIGEYRHHGPGQETDPVVADVEYYAHKLLR
jgi:hypothetical protein